MRYGFLIALLLGVLPSVMAAERQLVCSGIVRDELGAPCPDAEVRVVEIAPRDWPTVLATTRSDARGEFRLPVTLPHEMAQFADSFIRQQARLLDGPDWDDPPVRRNPHTGVHERYLQRMTPRFGTEFSEHVDTYGNSLLPAPLPHRLQVWVRGKEKQIGCSDPLPLNGPLQVDVWLLPNVARAASVMTKKEEPASGSVLSIAGISASRWALHHSGSYCYRMPRDWMSDYAMPVSEDGVARIAAGPQGALLVAIEGDGYAPGIMKWDYSTPATTTSGGSFEKFVAFDAESMRGKVRYLHVDPVPDGTAFFIRTLGWIQKKHASGAYYTGFGWHCGEIKGRDFIVDSTFSGSIGTAQHGRLELPTNHDGETKPIQFRLSGRDLPDLTAYRTAWVTGRLVDAELGVPLANHRAVFVFAEQVHNGDWRDVVVMSNSAGRFEAEVPIASYEIHDEANHRKIDWTEFAPKQRLNLGDVRLTHSHYLTGKVVDADSRPVPNAEVIATSNSIPVEKHVALPLYRADERGEFVVPLGKNYFGNLAVHARHGEAFSEPLLLTKSELGNEGHKPEPVELKLLPKRTVRLTGQVVDERGQALAQRSVIVWRELHHEQREDSRWLREYVVEVLKTDRTGRFRTDALHVSHAHYIQVRGPQGETVNSNRFQFTTPGHNDVGTFVMPSGVMKLSGRVVDGEGKPVAGVVVRPLKADRNVGEVVTDAAGQYQLADVPSTGTVLSFEHQHYRFAARIVRTSAAQTVRLWRRDEVPENLQIEGRLRAFAPADWVQDLPHKLDVLARQRSQRVVDLVTSMPKLGSSAKYALTRVEGRLDNRAALEAMLAVEPQENRIDFQSVPMLAAIAIDDIEKARGYIARMNVPSATHARLELAEYFASRDQQKARRLAKDFLDQKGTSLDEIKHPSLAFNVARAQQVLGDDDGLAAALKKAADLWEPIIASRHAFDSRTESLLFELMAQRAPEQAERIVVARRNARAVTGKQQEDEQHRYCDLTQLTAASANKWLDDVEARKLEPPHYSSLTDPLLLRRVSTADRTTGRRLAAFLRRYADRFDQRQLTAIFAMQDPASAWDIIDAEFAVLRSDAPQNNGNGNTTIFEKAAYQLAAAHELSYPDMDSLVAQCLTTYERFVAWPADGMQHERRLDGMVRGLANLAYFNPEEAQPLIMNLKPVIEGETLGTGQHDRHWRSNFGISRWSWHLALVQVAPELALSELEKEIAAFRETPPEIREDFGWGGRDPTDGLTALAEFWTTPAGQRHRFLYYPERR